MQHELREEYRKWRMEAKLSSPALKLYIYIGLHSNNWTGESWHSVARISEELQLDSRTVRRALSELSELDLIVRVQPTPRGPTYTYLRPLPAQRLTGRALEAAAIELLVSKGYNLIEKGHVLQNPVYREVDFLAEKNDMKYLVEVKYRISINDVMSWGRLAQRSEMGLVMICRVRWDEDVATAAKDFDVILFRVDKDDITYENQ